MTRKLNFMIIFIAAIFMFCLSSGEVKVSAKEEEKKESLSYCGGVSPINFISSTQYGDCIQTEKDGSKDIGKVKIESNGIITISYKQNL